MSHQKAPRIRFSIGNKIITGFVSLLIVLAISINLSITEFSKVKKISYSLTGENTPLMDRVQDLGSSLLKTKSLLINYVIINEKSDEYLMLEEWSAIDSDLNYIEDNLHLFNDVELITDFKKLKELTSKIKKEEFALINAQKNSSTIESNRQYIINSLTNISMLIKKSEMILNSNDKSFLASLKRSGAHLSKLLSDHLHYYEILEWVLLILGFLIALVIAYVTSRSIVKPIKSAIQIAKKISSGEQNIVINTAGRDETADLLVSLDIMNKEIIDSQNKLKESEKKVVGLLEDLQVRIRRYREHVALISSGDLKVLLEVSGDDDLATLGNYLNDMTSSLKKISKQIISAGNEILVGLNQLESTTSVQAASAIQQATAVTEISSIIEQMKMTSLQTLEKAMCLGESAETTQQESDKGRLAVDAMMQVMKSLEEKMKLIADTILGLGDKTQQIGEITETVSSLAKQSKMLALNAAIEAAKAGEAGKGFAVVANEVKEFAEQSQQATDRVQKILQDIRHTTERAVMSAGEGTKGVKSSLKQVHQADEIISALAEVINESSIASQQIVAAVRQETTGINQVVLSISEIDKATKQFAKATEETKQASIDLAHVASLLKESISIYKVD